MQTAQLDVDFASPGAMLNIRRHALSQGGIGDAPYTPRAIELVRGLRPQTVRFFVQEYFAMLPEPGRYRWDAVDAQLLSIAATGAAPILALAMKPPCLFPTIDQSITQPNNWTAWEQFISDMAGHFREDLKLPGLWYEVGNEPDMGEMGGCPYLFEPEDYAEYYDRTARAVLRGDPEARVGGPALAKFMGNKSWTARFAPLLQRFGSPLHFFSWHVYTPVTENLVERMHDCKQFLRELGEPFASATTVLDEWNISWVCNSQFGEFLQASFAVDFVARLLDTELDVSNYYHVLDLPMDLDKWRKWFSPSGLEAMSHNWNSDYCGLHMIGRHDQPAASYVAFKMLYEMDGQRLACERPSRCVGALASRSERACRVLVWNYNHEHIETQRVDVRIANLPKTSARSHYFRLGGAQLMDLDCVLAARRGEMRQVEEKHVELGADCFEMELTVEPHSVHLLILEW